MSRNSSTKASCRFSSSLLNITQPPKPPAVMMCDAWGFEGSLVQSDILQLFAALGNLAEGDLDMFHHLRMKMPLRKCADHTSLLELTFEGMALKDFTL